MSLDLNAVVTALFEFGVEHVLVKDFHRTGYNLLAELTDPRAEIIYGYHSGPVPGIGVPGDAQAVMFLGMHAASGTAGFLAHTLTSRIARLEVNGEPLAEVELFASALAPFGMRPVFYSGCPPGCSRSFFRGVRWPASKRERQSLIFILMPSIKRMDPRDLMLNDGGQILQPPRLRL